MEGLDPVQVFVHFVLDSLQFGPCHAGIDKGLGCFLQQRIPEEAEPLQSKEGSNRLTEVLKKKHSPKYPDTVFISFFYYRMNRIGII